MSSSAQRFPLPPAGFEPELARARLALVRVLPWLYARARRQLPGHVLSRLASSPEDLVQLTVLSVLRRIETLVAEHGVLPDWCASEAQLKSYMGGVLWRMSMRLIRDFSAARTESGLPEVVEAEPEPCAMERAEQSAQVRACVAHLQPDELRLIVGFGMGKSYAELSRRLGASPATLAKRRGRLLRRLRARCESCSYRLENGCTWIPRGWAE